jgi:hypothetical protein
MLRIEVMVFSKAISNWLCVVRQALRVLRKRMGWASRIYEMVAM